MSAIAELFEKIAHPTRVKIIRLLQDSPLNFSQLKAELNIQSNGNLDHHLKKLDTLVCLDAGGLYRLSDDGKEALRAIEVMESNITPKKPTTASEQGNKVFYVFLAITCAFPLSVAGFLLASATAVSSPAVLAGTIGGLIAVFVGLLVAVFGFRKTIKADTRSTESLTYFPSTNDPWSRMDWYRNIGFFGSYLSLFFSLVYIEFSPVDFPFKLLWVVLSLLALIALGFASQSMIYAVIEKANSRLRANQKAGQVQ
jgi:DNA-binding transcriptional ArsR family regulator